MKKLVSILTMVTVMFVTSQASASIYLEPYIGQAVSGKFTGIGSGVYNGSLLGARVGYGLLGLVAGLEYEMGSLKYEPDAGGSATMKPTNLGVTASFTFPVLVRAYGTYYFDSKLKDDDNDITYKGTGTKLGVGFTGFPFITVNLEATSFDFDKGLAANHYAVVVSLPLDF